MHLWCIVSWVQYIFGVAPLVPCIVSSIAQACYRSGAFSKFEYRYIQLLNCCRIFAFFIMQIFAQQNCETLADTLLMMEGTVFGCEVTTISDGQ